MVRACAGLAADQVISPESRDAAQLLRPVANVKLIYQLVLAPKEVKLATSRRCSLPDPPAALPRSRGAAPLLSKLASGRRPEGRRLHIIYCVSLVFYVRYCVTRAAYHAHSRSFG